MLGLDFVLQNLSSTFYTLSILSAWSLCIYTIYRTISGLFTPEFKVAVSSGLLIDREDTATSPADHKEWAKV
jgi:hypothetical protein